jgi:transposase
MTVITGEIAVFCGLDVGKGEHHATALSSAGKRLHDKKLPNTEPDLRELFTSLAQRGPVLVVVDQPASIGALPVAVAREMGCRIAYLPGLTMRRLADLYPGESKTDARDAFVIADAARTLPHTLRSIDTDDETVAELTMLTGFDEDLAAESTRIRNRIRGLLSQIHPGLERVLGRRLDHPAVLALLETFPTPSMMAATGHDALLEVLRPYAPRLAERLVTDVFTALDEQTVVVAGTSAAATILPHLTTSLRSILEQRDTVAAQVEHLLEDHPLSRVLTSIPGIAVRTAARILVEIGDASGFRSAAHLAAYAGLAPATRRSGSSIRGEHPSQRGNKQLKRALYLSAFASLRDPQSHAYYQRKRSEGKHHVAALTCLARRRVDVLFAMLRDHTLYQPATPSPA